MTKFKQLGKLPGRPSELIRSAVFLQGNKRAVMYRWPGVFMDDKETLAGYAFDYLLRGELKEAFEMLGLKLPRRMKPKVYVNWSCIEIEMFDLARQLEERGY